MKSKLKTNELTLIGLGAALMAVFSQLAIPLPTVPLTLQVFGAVLLTMVLGTKVAAFTMVIYILLGAIGIPVFSNFGRGIGLLAGPTGGYIWGFILLSFIVGKATEQKNKVVRVVGVYLGVLVQYAIGTIQLKTVLQLSLQQAMVAGVYPFILKDILLVGVALVIGMHMRKRLGGTFKQRVKCLNE